MKNNNEITNILRRVVEINQKGGDLLATLTVTGLSIVNVNNEFKTISKHFLGDIYFRKDWVNSYPSMLKGMNDGLDEIEKSLGGKEEC